MPRHRTALIISLVLIALFAAYSVGSSAGSSNPETPPAAGRASSHATSSLLATTDPTLAVHIYQCQQYSNNGVPDLKLSTTEISGGTVSISGVTSSAQSNPYHAAVSSGTYTVSATAPAGYYFTDCPSEPVTPTLSNQDQSASASVTVPSTGTTLAFYVVAFQTATCSATNGGVTCELPNSLGLPFYPLSTLISNANGVSSSVSISTPMVITAYGGNGGSGYIEGPGGIPSGGSGGAGGEAQTTFTSITSYEKTYGEPAIFYYLGYEGLDHSLYSKDTVGGLGGTSTIVSPDNFASGTTKPCINGYDSCSSTTNALLDAGGGGGGGQGGDSASGGSGGAGGNAVATTAPAYAMGSNGSSTSGSGGHGGYGAGQNPVTEGAGGNGGKSGDGLDSHSGGTGASGIGGEGGSTHKKSGPSAAIPWANVGYLSIIGGTGSGGEGEWRTSLNSAVGGSGSGGGGFGGGGAGGSGGSTDAGGGGGGGGSFAVAEQTAPATFTTPAHSESTGQVFVTFVLS